METLNALKVSSVKSTEGYSFCSVFLEIFSELDLKYFYNPKNDEN